MRKYDIIPLPELRRQYQIEKNRRDNLVSSVMMILWSLLFTGICLFL